MRWSFWRGLLVGGALLAMAPAAGAQAPPEVAEIAHCLCLHRAIDAHTAGMTERRQAYDQVQSELAALDSELARERATMNVDDPQAVARFRQLLARRDAVFQRSTGPLATDLSTAVGGYNAAVREYNTRCADQPRDPELLARVQATLSCPAP
jgi:hypothetical protein